MSAMTKPALACVPPAGRNTPALYVTSAAAVAAGTVLTLDFGEEFAFGKLGLVRFKMRHIGGGAASFTPYIFSKAGVTTPGDISQEYAGSSTLVADLFDPQLANAPVVMQCDENGRLYLMPTPNADVNNQFAYALRFLVYGP